MNKITPWAPLHLLKDAFLVFWDFDGVIKDSVEVKSDAFERLFLPYGAKIARRVRQHHEANGGMSRFEKLPLYLRWAGEITSPAKVEEFCLHFSSAVRQAVIDAPWVPGVQEFLLTQHVRQAFILTTATPGDEIEEILENLALTRCFREIHGAPKSKSEAIRETLLRWQCPPERTLMVGDSTSDLKAAKTNNVPFLLRKTPFNRTLRETYSGPIFEELSNE